MGALHSFWSYGRRNPTLIVGLIMLLIIVLLGVAGPIFVNVDNSRPLSAMAGVPPSLDNPLGTDDMGRDLFAVLIAGIPRALEIGLLAGAIGVGVGMILGFVSGYLGGAVDAIIRGVVDTLLTVPGLVVLITIAATIREVLSVGALALVIALLAWMYPTRLIRSQVLSLRERAYVKMAKLNGMSTAQIIMRELFPNLLPYLAASYVGAVSGAVLASIGLEALGLGPQNDPTIGMTIYWAMTFSALIRGMWWWWAPPITFIILLFIALFLVSSGLDEVANPRLRRSE
jgi:peptide/nickel transport system permease protein